MSRGKFRKGTDHPVRIDSGQPQRRDRTTPRSRSQWLVASNTGDTIHAASTAATVSNAQLPATLCGLMAKAKRRKLRARRSKANHGRRPNAGRG